MKGKVKNAPLEASNVAVLLEHIPIGATRSIHSLQVKRVEADHYSIAGGPVIDLVDAMAQIGAYSGKHSNPKGARSKKEATAEIKERLALAKAEAKQRRERAAEKIKQLRAARAELAKARAAKRAERTSKTKKSNPAAKFERGKAAGGGHREERGYFYEVLNSAGTVVALTTSKDEAQDVCDNPKQLGLPKSQYSFRHIGGKKLVPTTEAGTRARKVK